MRPLRSFFVGRRIWQDAVKRAEADYKKGDNQEISSVSDYQRAVEKRAIEIYKNTLKRRRHMSREMLP